VKHVFDSHDYARDLAGALAKPVHYLYTETDHLGRITTVGYVAFPTRHVYERGRLSRGKKKRKPISRKEVRRRHYERVDRALGKVGQ